MTKKPLLLLIAALLLVAIPAQAQEGPQTPSALCEAATPAQSGETLSFDAAEEVLEEDVDYLAVFCTSAGPILVDLYEELTPITVNNFVFLAQSGYYNNTNFHRVIPDFMAQAGDPTNTGSGNPGYQFEDEVFDDLLFDHAGQLAMANAGPGTNGGQFFITTVATDWLNGNHTIFGDVLAGQTNVESIRIRDPQQSLEPGTLLETVVIVQGAEAVEVVEEALEPASRDTADAALETLDFYVSTILDRFGVAFGDPLSENFTADEMANAVLDTDAVVASIEGAQVAAAEFFASHNHEYSLNAVYANSECALDNLPIYSVSYRLDAYPSAEEAAAALEDPALADLQAAQDFEPYAGDFPLTYAAYTRAQTNCDLDMVAARAFVQRGRFVTMQELVVTADNADIAALLPEAFTMPLFEDALADMLRPELVAASE